MVPPARLQRGAIETGISRQEMAALIQAGHIVVLPKLFDSAVLLDLRQAVLDWSNDTPLYPHGEAANVPRINFHRRDDGSRPSLLPHMFHQYAFGDWDRLEAGFSRALKSVCQPLLELQNELAGTDFSPATANLRCKIINNPAGGGHLVKHAHPYLPQKVAFFLSLSRYGQDFQTGAVTFDTPRGTIELTELFNIGNAVYFKYDLPHAATPVDPLRRLDWSSPAGLWILSMELVESHPNSRRVA